MSLAAMIAKQKAAQAEKANESSKPAAGANVPVAAESPTAAPAAPAARLKFGIKKKGEDNASGGTKVSPASQSVGNPPARQPAVDPVADVTKTVLTLDDLENTTVEGIESSGNDSARGQYTFHDEIPSTAPTRELPPELTDSQREFVTQLNSIYEIVHDPELFGQMIRTIMQELQENPDYSQLMADQDVHTMIRGLRQSMGLAKIKKAEKSTKTRAGAKKTPTATAMAGTADALFNDSDW